MVKFDPFWELRIVFFSFLITEINFKIKLHEMIYYNCNIDFLGVV